MDRPLDRVIIVDGEAPESSSDEGNQSNQTVNHNFWSASMTKNEINQSICNFISLLFGVR